VHQVNVHEAKTHLSRLLSRVAAGEQIVISKAGRPIARLVPIKGPRTGKRRLGRDREKIRVAPDFNAPLPPEVLEYFS
jgi:prevent-host-death family protein